MCSAHADITINQDFNIHWIGFQENNNVKLFICIKIFINCYESWSYTVVKRIIKYMFYTFNSNAMQMLDEIKISGDANPTILTRNSKTVVKENKIE